MVRLAVVFLTLFAMYWTWQWVHAPERDRAFFIHGALKSKLQEMLGEAILAQRPQARDMEFLSFWTESRSPEEIHLFFTYRFVDDLTPQYQKEVQEQGQRFEIKRGQKGEGDGGTTGKRVCAGF